MAKLALLRHLIIRHIDFYFREKQEKQNKSPTAIAPTAVFNTVGA